ncbi:MAG TPA: ABC transporter ATP-binding protein [Acidimicrobiales bacterium]|jgi:ABC-2 type transport system ATP-binding protein|nr:ABC transporter ATP-binding protein [Acidimicrobiales bacterium]
MNAIETYRLGKRYGRTWALRDCTVAIPAGRVVALVGPNGAGKTTLLQLAVGLIGQSSGEIMVLGGIAPGSPEALDGVAFVAQDTPLYKSLSVADTLRLVSNLANTWDGAHARARLDALGIPLRRKVGQLSGGQQAQVALAVALARHPRLLILDEPVAELDPLARHDFMSILMEAVAADGVSVVFSSHVLSELERVCDYLILLSHGSVQLADGTDELLATHRVLTGPVEQADAVGTAVPVVYERRAGRQARLLVRTTGHVTLPAGWQADASNLEEIVLSYLRSPDASALPGPDPVRSATSTAVIA